MSKKPATENELSELHAMVARKMKEDLKSGEVNAAYLSVITKFLKDNGIECEGQKNDDLQDIAANLPNLEEVDEHSFN